MLGELVWAAEVTDDPADHGWGGFLSAADDSPDASGTPSGDVADEVADPFNHWLPTAAPGSATWVSSSPKNPTAAVTSGPLGEVQSVPTVSATPSTTLVTRSNRRDLDQSRRHRPGVVAAVDEGRPLNAHIDNIDDAIATLGRDINRCLDTNDFLAVTSACLPSPR